MQPARMCSRPVPDLRPILPVRIQPPRLRPTTCQRQSKRPILRRSPPTTQYRQLVVGTWEDDYQGKRTMTLKEDGTGTMIVELSGMQATLFASRLEFDMVWSLENGRLKKHTVGGRPETRVNMILKMMGDRVDEPVLELTPDRLLLLDKDGRDTLRLAEEEIAAYRKSNVE